MKLRLLALALVVCGGAAAQNPYIALQGADETSGGIVVSQPRTVLAVDVTAERDVTLSGPYARYAQKFLGVRAPLTDKMSWAVTGASVALLDPKAVSYTHLDVYKRQRQYLRGRPRTSSSQTRPDFQPWQQITPCSISHSPG